MAVVTPATDEIEVTPEMIEAGIRAMSCWADYDEMAEDVYVAMERVRRDARRKTKD